MKLTHKLFHRMTNRSCKLQGCSLIYTGMAKDVDVPVLSLTLGISYHKVNPHIIHILTLNDNGNSLRMP